MTFYGIGELVQYSCTNHDATPLPALPNIAGDANDRALQPAGRSPLRLDISEERHRTRQLLVPGSYCLRASTTVFCLPELRQNILQFTDDASREVLSTVSKNWHVDLANDAAFVRRFEKILCLPAGAAASWELPVYARETASILARMLHKIVHGRALNSQEDMLNASLPAGIWDNVNRTLERSERRRQEAFGHAINATLHAGAGVAGGLAGWGASAWLYAHGWLAPSGYAWDASNHSYIRTEADSWYEPRRVKVHGYAADGPPRCEVPTSPEAVRSNLAVLSAFGAAILFVPAYLDAVQTFQSLRDRTAMRQRLLNNCTVPL